MAGSFKAGNPGCCCTFTPPCSICVYPGSPCGTALGATVSIYGNVDGMGVKSADIDPAENNTLYGSGTIDSPATPYCLIVEPGVYMVQTEADGYDTDNRIVFVCTGCTFPIGTSYYPYDGAASVTTGGQSTVLDQPYSDVGTLFQFQCNREALVLTVGGFSEYPFASTLVTATDPFHQIETDTTGTVVYFYAGCGGDPYTVYYYVNKRTNTKYLAPGSSFAIGGGYYILRVEGTITNVQVEPFKIEGVWESFYSYFCITNGGNLDGAHYPASSGPLTEAQAATYASVFGTPPITGSFTIE